MKQCRDCKQDKNISLFVKNKIFKDGIDTLCLECNRDRVKKYRLAGKANRTLEAQKYYKKHPHKCVARTAKYKAKKLQATLKWLTNEEYWLIDEIYELAQLRTKITGIKWEVDHIVPLTNSKVCGLHVPWNLQVITKYENARKWNKL
jgi:hypothetical protein